MKTESPGGHNRFSVTGRLLIAGRLVPGALVVDGDRIVEARIGRADAAGVLPEPRLDGDIVSPGLVDLQCNGAFGLEVGADGGALRTLASRLPATGVTTFLPTVVSASAAQYRAVAAALAAVRDAPGAQLPGLHLEGPLLSPARAGAHDVQAIAAADATLDDVLDELLGAGALRLITLAPERAGALDRIRRLVGAGVTVSLGHTDATFEQMQAGIDAGATLVTHLFNAMSGFHHRRPDALGAALTDDRVAVGLIADGVHAHPAALKLALRAKGADRIVLVTDAVAAAGASPGAYQLGGIPIVSDGQSARRGDGTLAGSTLTMDRAVRAMVSLSGARIEEALAMASSVPAVRVGLGDRGALAVGQRADLALWSAKLEVEATIVGGEIVFRS
jgi:N-acetylglucosamine-6-phosphate deacetylase